MKFKVTLILLFIISEITLFSKIYFENNVVLDISKFNKTLKIFDIDCINESDSQIMFAITTNFITPEIPKPLFLITDKAGKYIWSKKQNYFSANHEYASYIEDGVDNSVKCYSIFNYHDGEQAYYENNGFPIITNYSLQDNDSNIFLDTAYSPGKKKLLTRYIYKNKLNELYSIRSAGVYGQYQYFTDSLKILGTYNFPCIAYNGTYEYENENSTAICADEYFFKKDEGLILNNVDWNEKLKCGYCVLSKMLDTNKVDWYIPFLTENSISQGGNLIVLNYSNYFVNINQLNIENSNSQTAFFKSFLVNDSGELIFEYSRKNNYNLNSKFQIININSIIEHNGYYYLAGGILSKKDSSNNPIFHNIIIVLNKNGKQVDELIWALNNDSAQSSMINKLIVNNNKITAIIKERYRYLIFCNLNTDFVSINESNNQNKFNLVSPNPAADIINLPPDASEFEIINLQGEKMLFGKGNKPVIINSLPKGIYLITIVDINNTRTMSKFIKE